MGVDKGSFVVGHGFGHASRDQLLAKLFGILRSRQNPKILWVDDAEIV
jgi:hypothetical protein